MTNYEITMEEKVRNFFTVKSFYNSQNGGRYMQVLHQYANPEEVKFKINANYLKVNVANECYREIMVSFLPLLPLLEKTVHMKDADYILYAHAYARCHDLSSIVVRQIKHIDMIRKEGAQIIVVGKAANAEKLLNGSVKNIIFWHDHIAEKLGQKFDVDMKDQYIVYDDYWYDHANIYADKKGQLNIWPVNGCNRKCKFCRRSYMYIPYDYLELNKIKETLDWYQENYPERMEYVSLRAENLTEYPWLVELLDLLNSYSQIKKIEIPIGMAICGITKEILNAIRRCTKIVQISLNPETGTDRLLQTIGKEHTRKWALYVFREIRKALPNVRIESTVMVGLPTETVGDIYKLADFIGKAQIDYVVCNYYIDNPGQPLSRLPQLSKVAREYHLEVLKKRLKIEIQKKCILECASTNEKIRKRYKKEMEAKQHEDFPIHLGQWITYPN